jgi:ABC-type multidrug transport system ATPase subunit
LIEVGAGFHPDLSGRENIYLNGSILGLSRQEITAKFDSIVDFAGLEKFIDTPVKRYSSGMYMRLGFSIAAHTEPNILLIDEVLAVGDTIFQRKCIRHLKEFVKRGGAVVFVSHAMNQVEEVCETCLWLDYGRQLFFGPTHQAIEQYMTVVSEREEAEFKRLYPKEWEIRQAERQREEEARRLEEEMRDAERQRQEAGTSEPDEEAAARRAAEARYLAWLNDPKRCRLTGLVLRDATGEPVNHFVVGQAFAAEISFHARRPLRRPSFSLEFFRQEDGMHMFSTSNYDHQLHWPDLPEYGTVRLDIPFMSLNTGSYVVRVRFYSDWRSDAWDDVLEDEMNPAAIITVDGGRFGHGCTYLPVQWTTGPTATAPYER